jgi:single-stranded-DNA-specific exonuclease
MIPPDTNEKIWEILAEPTAPNRSEERGALPPVIASILAQRGLVEPAAIQLFLSPSLEHLPAPQTMLGLKQAVTLLREALSKRIPVLIYGDYDADGICATALLANFFREIGLIVVCYLPDRLGEGYGLNLEALHRLRLLPELAGQEAPLLVTVDCGITNTMEIAAARNLGFRVIVTDHHQPGPELPPADAILNPKQSDCHFLCRELAGVGVAFYLAAGLRSALSADGFWAEGTAPNLKKYLDLVAVGSVADLVPLTGANRILVKAGLEVLNSAPGPGLAALIKKAGLIQGNLGAEGIAYQLAPRINAAGRVGSATAALELLRTDSSGTAANLAEQLEEANRQRKSMTEKMSTEARQLALGQLTAEPAALVLGSRDWHPGIVGLIASRLVNDFWRPTVVLAIGQDGSARGSVRSVAAIDIHAVLKECAGSLDKFGGHSQAAGLTLKEEKIAEFTESFCLAVARAAAATDLPMKPVLRIDLQAEIEELMAAPVWHYLKLMEPFGMGNSEPLFCSKPSGIKLARPKKVGADSLRFQVPSNGNTFNGIGFGLADWLNQAEKNPLRLAYKICRNEFRGVERWEIRVEDIKTAI